MSHLDTFWYSHSVLSVWCCETHEKTHVKKQKQTKRTVLALLEPLGDAVEVEGVLLQKKKTHTQKHQKTSKVEFVRGRKDVKKKS